MGKSKHKIAVYLEARPNDYRAWHELLIVAQLADDRDSANAALAALRTGGEFDRFAATTAGTCNVRLLGSTLKNLAQILYQPDTCRA